METPLYRRKEIAYTFKDGDTIKLYTINTLASALGRQSDTIRKWEINGVIPKTCFKRNGIRLYSEEQIDAIVKSAEESKISTGKPISKTSFASLVHKRMEELRIKYSKKNGVNEDAKTKEIKQSTE